MHYAEIVYMFVFSVGCNADWVEIPSFAPPPKVSGSSFYSGSKTPVNVVFHQGQIENLEARNVSMDNRQTATEQSFSKRTKSNRITATPAKSSILSVFSSTTQFTPLMSSISLSQTPVTEPTILKKTSQGRQSQPKENSVNNASTKHVEEIEVEDYVEPEENASHESYENKSEPEQSSFSSFAGFLPFLKSIQSTLMQKAHKSIKSKIQVLKNLRDNLLYDIDQRLRRLWPGNENKLARDYKGGDSHMEFPSNEGALMTIGFLTLAVFLVKLVLQVIHAIKAKKQVYYNGTTTASATASAATFGRKKRFVDPDAETTYKILSSIENFETLSWN